MDTYPLQDYRLKEHNSDLKIWIWLDFCVHAALNKKNKKQKEKLLQLKK